MKAWLVYSIPLKDRILMRFNWTAKGHLMKVKGDKCKAMQMWWKKKSVTFPKLSIWKLYVGNLKVQQYPRHLVLSAKWAEIVKKEKKKRQRWKTKCNF